MKTRRSFNQLVVPKGLRRQVMSVNHESAFSGHLGAKKTEVRMLSNFFWQGLCQDVIRFCCSCDVCQRTIKRGSVKKVPLGSMPLIKTPFKSVAVDIVGPTALPRPAEAMAQTDQPCSVCLQRRHSVRGPGTILKELWTKEVNIPKVKYSYENVTELRERLEDSLSWPRKNWRSLRNATRDITTRRPNLDN